MNPTEYRQQGHTEEEVQAFAAGYASVRTGDQITMTLADTFEGRSDDPYVGGDVQTALAARVSGGPHVSPVEMQGFLRNARAETVAAAKVAQSEVTRPGSGPDAHDREAYYQRAWVETVGRVFTAEELSGTPVPGCVACSRLAGLVCDEHARRLGEPIPYPPHPWPSETVGSTPGMIVMRPGHYPGDLARTVA